MTIGREQLEDDIARAFETRIGRALTAAEKRAMRRAIVVVLSAEQRRLGPIVAIVRAFRAVRLRLFPWLP